MPCNSGPYTSQTSCTAPTLEELVVVVVREWEEEGGGGEGSATQLGGGVLPPPLGWCCFSHLLLLGGADSPFSSLWVVMRPPVFLVGLCCVPLLWVVRVGGTAFSALWISGKGPLLGLVVCANIFLDLTSFLDFLYWPQGPSDVGKFGISFLELLVHVRAVGWTLSSQWTCYPPHRRADRPLVSPTTLVSRGVGIRHWTRFIDGKFCSLSLTRFVP